MATTNNSSIHSFIIYHKIYQKDVYCHVTQRAVGSFILSRCYFLIGNNKQQQHPFIHSSRNLPERCLLSRDNGTIRQFHSSLHSFKKNMSSTSTVVTQINANAIKSEIRLASLCYFLIGNSKQQQHPFIHQLLKSTKKMFIVT